MSELTEIALITTIGMWISLTIMFGIWLLKQHFKHQYLLKRARLAKHNKAAKSAVKEPSSLGALSDIASIAKSLEGQDIDQIMDLIEGVSGGGSGGGLGGLLDNPAVTSFLEGLSGGPKKPPTETGPNLDNVY
jgi:hypothetical protein